MLEERNAGSGCGGGRFCCRQTLIAMCGDILLVGGSPMTPRDILDVVVTLDLFPRSGEPGVRLVRDLLDRSRGFVKVGRNLWRVAGLPLGEDGAPDGASGME